jgi:hypothetical protein
MESKNALVDQSLALVDSEQCYIHERQHVKKTKWVGNSKCQFCEEEESLNQLLFTSAAAKCVLTCVAKAIGAHNGPGSFSKFSWWFSQYLPTNRNVQIDGIASIWWVIRKLFNRSCFKEKLIKSPLELICYFVVFMNYWTCLNNTANQIVLTRVLKFYCQWLGCTFCWDVRC